MRWLVIIVAGAWAASLLGLGIPRLIGSVLKAPAFSTVLAVNRGEKQPEERLEIAAASLEQAMQWEKSGRVRSDLGLVLLLRAAQADPQDDQRSRLAQEAATVLRESLHLAPASPRAWVWLAYTTLPASGPPPEVVELLKQSLRAGAFVGGITVPRVELLLRNWAYLPTDVRVIVAKQIRFVWPHKRQEIIAASKRTGTVHILRFAIRSLPGALDQLDTALAKSRS